MPQTRTPPPPPPPPPSPSSPPINGDAKRIAQDAVDASLRSIKGITTAALHLNPRGLVQLGLIILIATPIARVVFCIVGFIRQKDQLYTGISTVVLIILLYSLTKGAH